MQVIANFPIMFYATIMGLGGLNLALERFFVIFNYDMLFVQAFAYVNLGLFILISAIYLLKTFLYFSHVRAEFTHPVKINFTATIPISMLILATLFKGNATLHAILFYPAMIAQVYLSFYVISFWINRNLDIKHSNPAYFIPIVGNLIVIIAAREPDPWCWYFFGVALFFWIILFSIIFYRILFHEQMAAKFMPTLFIMIAPPSVAFLDYVKLTGVYDIFASMLLYIAIFFMGLVVFMYKNFLKLKFFISWWAFTFPSAAMALALLKAYELRDDNIFLYLGFFAFVMLCIMIVIVGYYTIKNIANKSIFIAE